MNMLAQLKAHFPAKAVSWRCGPTNREKTKGMALAYIDARDVMQRLDEVCGELWQSEYVPMPNGTCCCRIGIFAGGQWVWRASGAVNIADSDKADAKEMAEKGSYSDAFKRAAVMWGVGRYLYDLPSPWVEIDDRKQITERGLADLAARLQEFAKRNSQAPITVLPTPAAKPAPEVVNPQTGEITSAPPADVVREVIKAHEPAPAPAAPAAPVAPATTQAAPLGRPSCIVPGSKLPPEVIKARKEKEAAEEKQRFIDESRATADEWVEMLRDTCKRAKDPSIKTHTITSEFAAWDQVRNAMWNKLTPKDQGRVRDAYTKAKGFVDQRRATAAA